MCLLEEWTFFPFHSFNKYLSPSLPPSHINILAKIDEVPTHLEELKYFYGGGCAADGRGWEMCHAVIEENEHDNFR